ncbi:hypothetical protein [Cohnella luojiensis]|uniref:DUF2642 domain-containing protein n=1 Tax=Cohnella luojiensis TaxID=652876 RepID=A0A4Y8LYY1_9BACL|nr:hypothetical protein [Cohnella luojiensis]TFE27186.1 hypothetical protein E2980_09785 [Cohnella luojiensis]
MDFADILATFIGRTVEVFQTTQFLSGQLVAVTPGTFTVQTSQNIYTPSTVRVNVVIENTEFVRILPA